MDPQQHLMDLARSGYAQIIVRGDQVYKRFVSQFCDVPTWAEVLLEVTPHLEASHVTVICPTGQKR